MMKKILVCVSILASSQYAKCSFSNLAESVAGGSGDKNTLIEKGKKIIGNFLGKLGDNAEKLADTAAKKAEKDLDERTKKAENEINKTSSQKKIEEEDDDDDDDREEAEKVIETYAKALAKSDARSHIITPSKEKIDPNVMAALIQKSQPKFDQNALSKILKQQDPKNASKKR